MVDINPYVIYTYHAPLAEHRAVRYKLKSCTVPIFVLLVTSLLLLYCPDVCNCTVPYVPRTVPVYAVQDPAQTAEVVDLTLVETDVIYHIHQCYGSGTVTLVHPDPDPNTVKKTGSDP